MFDFVGEAVAGLARAVGEFVIEVVVQPLLEATGYWVLRPFVRHPEKRPGLCLLIGLAIWIPLIVVLIGVFVSAGSG